MSQTTGEYNYYSHSEFKLLENVASASFSISFSKFLFYFSYNFLLKFSLVWLEDFFLNLNEFIVSYAESCWDKMFW